VLNSFRPAPAWQGRIAAGLVAIYAQEADILVQMGRTAVRGAAVQQQMIAGFGRSMQQMQLRTFQALQARSYRTGQDWIATFAGNENLRDPATGKVCSVPYGYGSYCLDDRGATPTVLMGADMAPAYPWAPRNAGACWRPDLPNGQDQRLQPSLTPRATLNNV
jgi:hypothetical protein